MLEKNWTNLIKPSSLDIRSEKTRGLVAKMVAEPLERGFGMTLGLRYAGSSSPRCKVRR